MGVNIERVTEGSTLGEGPHWDVDSQTLYFVDIIGKTLNKYVPATKKHTKVSVDPASVTFIIPVQGKKNQFVVSMDHELAIISWDGESDKVTVVEKLGSPETTPEIANNKFNDGKCDSVGRLWAGTFYLPPNADINATKPVGVLYSFDSGRKLKSHVNKIRVANGLAWNDQIKKMFYIDSLKEAIDQYDFDLKTGTLSNPQTLFSLKKHNVPGIPDGMAIDADGNLWVATFGGSRVIKIDSKKPETLLDTIELPAQQVTSIAFGGKNLDEMYVTTGAMEREGQSFPKPVNGATYKITGTGSKGLPGVSFKF